MNTPVKPGALRRVEKNLEVMTFCGLCCPDCHGCKGKIPDLAHDIRKEPRGAKYDKVEAKYPCNLDERYCRVHGREAKRANEKKFSPVSFLRPMFV